MKKIKLSVAALSIAMSMNAQDKIKTFTSPDKVTIDKLEVIEMINTIDDILFWNSEDAAECECIKNGSYEEGWGSNYWLRIMRDKLKDNLHTQRVSHKIDTSKYVYITYEGVDCETCAEID